MVFIAAGVRRSASTLTYQIACEIVGLDYRIRRWKDRPHDIYEKDQWWVAKSHNYLPEAASYGLGKIIPYITIRDPRDIAVSMMTLHGNTFEKIMDRGIIQRDHAHFNMWVDNLDLGENCFVDRYEDFSGDTFGLAECISSVMQISVKPKTLYQIVEKFSFENNKQRSDTIGKSEPDLLFPGHVQTGGIGMWKEVLSADQANRMVDAIGEEWFLEWGYDGYCLS